ncbi:MAG TPA: hypothetical protein VEL47_00120, partial [Myxococcota bacterium]|nr:hypothetical protein [Myxococcota bacterium]
MKIALLIINLTAACSAVASQSASPSLNSHCSHSVATPKNGTSVMFDETCTVAYVMPPRQGVAEIGSLAR